LSPSFKAVFELAIMSGFALRLESFDSFEAEIENEESKFFWRSNPCDSMLKSYEYLPIKCVIQGFKLEFNKKEYFYEKTNRKHK
jgi:hypothetical protein